MTAGRKNITDNKDWCTPRKYVVPITEFFGGTIDLDPCSNSDSIVNANIEYLLPEHDGLKESWAYARIFVNPPYGRDKASGTTIKDWLRRCHEAGENGSEVIALIPVATNTTHWKEYVFGSADSICFLYDTRLKFLEGGFENKKGAPMACCIVYWGKYKSRFMDVFNIYGAVVDVSKLKQTKNE